MVFYFETTVPTRRVSGRNEFVRHSSRRSSNAGGGDRLRRDVESRYPSSPSFPSSPRRTYEPSRRIVSPPRSPVYSRRPVSPPRSPVREYKKKYASDYEDNYSTKPSFHREKKYEEPADDYPRYEQKYYDDYKPKPKYETYEPAAPAPSMGRRGSVYRGGERRESYRIVEPSSHEYKPKRKESSKYKFWS